MYVWLHLDDDILLQSRLTFALELSRVLLDADQAGGRAGYSSMCVRVRSEGSEGEALTMI